MGNKVSVEPHSNSTNNKQTKSLFSNIFNTKPKQKFVLGIIDPQNDFCEGGSLAVLDANKIFGSINKLRYICVKHGIKTFISQDFHHLTHMSFASTHDKPVFSNQKLDLIMENGDKLTLTQTMWPTHCVQGTRGAEFYSDLFVFFNDKIIQKGTKKNVESYSAFGDEFNNSYEKTGLYSWLVPKKITDIILVGLATDYCVYNTGLDAVKYGFTVHVILSCVRGVDPTTTSNAIQDMKLKGVIFYNDVFDFVNKNNKVFNNNNLFL
jgi:nicotinamidase/pyrazinamidase